MSLVSRLLMEDEEGQSRYALRALESHEEEESIDDQPVSYDPDGTTSEIVVSHSIVMVMDSLLHLVEGFRVRRLE